ncbi:hypothetical protein NDU88_008386 [Pleurodeles waltl]|uniref:Uncharacterized protein n=1 Tax=Pleurodeles waltl TaxID=8319 RepID=A0AAV7SV34_PLEWA|nr:hypothetical protein NDU88_008386 [Pleurodeles waltl]
MHGKRGGVCRFLWAHTDDALMLFHAARALRQFPVRRLGSSLGLRGIWTPRGQCGEILGVQDEVTGAASIQGNFCRMAGAASVPLTGSRLHRSGMAMRRYSTWGARLRHSGSAMQ